MPEPTTNGNSLAAWREYVRDRRKLAYWPGPWSIRADASEQLIGRADDAEKIRYAIFDRNLVVLSGDSGVGKSSLLNAGIVPGLRRDGFVVAVCNTWSGRSDKDATTMSADATSEFLAAKLAADLRAQDVPIDEDSFDPSRLIEELNDRFGSRAVIVLDQFEELIRQQPELYWSIRTWIEKVVDASRVRIVISLRAEYAHHLVDLDVSPYRRLDWVVDPINKMEFIEEIVRSGRYLRQIEAPEGTTDFEVVPEVAVIDDDAVRTICAFWDLAGGTGGATRIRLLHLQAALFVLWNASPEHPPITAAMVEDHFALAQTRKGPVAGTTAPASTKQDAIDYFEWAISRVVDIHLKLCQEALENTRPSGFADRFLEEGALAAVVRMAEYLSSGGYKVDQDRVHLGQLVLTNELRALGFFKEETADSSQWHARDIIGRFASSIVDAETEHDGFDWVAAPGRVLRERMGVALTRAGHDDSAGAGPLMGLSAHSILVEECRRYFFALEWLAVGELVRLSPSDEGKVVTLSHDGFGRGLNEWARQNDARPEAALTRLTESRGEVFEWRDARSSDPEVNPLVAPPGQYVRHTNLRWRSCRVVGALLERVVFFGCDFRGTSFANCTFRGVTFVNCILDGVQLEECVIAGRTTPLEKELADGIRADRALPSFIDPEPLDAADDSLSDALTLTDDAESDHQLYNHYRDHPVEAADVMYSGKAGVETVPASYLETRDDEVEVLRYGKPVLEALRVSHVKTREDDDVPITARWEPQSGGLVMFGGRLSSLAFYACTFESDGPVGSGTPAGVSLRHVAGTSLDFFEHTGGCIELYDAAIRGVSISPVPPSLRRQPEVAATAEFRALECHLENVWFSTGLHGEALIEQSVVWQLFNANPADDSGFRVRLDDDSPYGGVVNVTEASTSPRLQRGFTTNSLGAVPLEEVARFADAIDYRSPSREQRPGSDQRAGS